MEMVDAEKIRTAVRERYAKTAVTGSTCCGPEPVDAGACCDAPVSFTDGRSLPEEIAVTSLGCGAPVEAAALRFGETVIDLGSGAGLDVFLAADRVGPAGRAIGVDMTPEMIARARANATRLGATSVEFRLGEIEHLPIREGTADVVMSNCVINLLPDKRTAFAEAYRVLKPGGRLVVSDIVSDGTPIPEALKTVERWTACLAGAIPVKEYIDTITQSGFEQVEVLSSRNYGDAGLLSVTIRAAKPQ